MNRPDIAIVGLACRFPGGCETPEDYWRLLADGRDAVTEIPDSRWDKATFYNPNPQIHGRTYTTRAGVLDDVAGFDAAFFGISPREAEQMDPQQRLLLEMAWESMERGGQVPSHLAGSRMAVYVGISGTDYADIRQGDPAGGNAYFMLGSTLSIAANRLSYIFDLHGPSMAVDTACSSALVAMNEAVNAIWGGRAATALVGGVNLLLSPFPFMGFSKAAMLSPYGQCRAFDRIAEGYVRAEGGGVVLLKPLDQAEADGDPVYAVVRGVGANADGRTNGIALPRSSQQEALLREVYGQIGIDPADVDYFEAHGTGTAVGDPAEAQAIGRAIGQARAKSRPLPIGSAKTNLGHLEPASGMAGLFKALGVLRTRTIPASLHLDEPNPNIDFADLNLSPVRSATPIPDLGRPAIVGVNSFGFGGANAHVVLQEYVARQDRTDAGDGPAQPGEAARERADPAPLLLSARDGDGLCAAAGRLAGYLRGADAAAHADVASTLAHRREHHEHRLVLRRAPADALDALQSVADGGAPDGTCTGSVLVSGPAKVALIFAGNGAQWPGMGAQLLDEDPVFARGVHAVDALVRQKAGWSVVAELTAGSDASPLTDTRVAQPLLFAVQVGLIDSLRACGLEAACAAGHSVGEVAAAYAAGALDLEQAVHVILMRSKAQGETAGMGRMAACEIGEERARREIAVYDGAVEVAAVNGPTSVTLSGDADALVEIGRKLKAESIPFRLLDLDYAFHNRVLDPVQDMLLSDLAGLSPSDGQLPFYSTVTGGRLEGRQLDARYWWDNVRQPVRFYDAVASMVEAGCNLFLEVGPHPITQSYVRSTLRQLDAQGQPFASMTQREAGGRRVHHVLDQLWCAGAPLAWDRVVPDGTCVGDLPTYPWQRERHWFKPTAEAQGPLFHPRCGPLLGLRPMRDVPVWESEIDTGSHPYLADHVVGGSAIFPAAGFVELALEAAAVLFEDGRCEIESLEMRRPLGIEQDRTKVVRFLYDPHDCAFRIESRTRLHDEPWSLHCKGRLTQAAAGRTPEPLGTAALGPDAIDPDTHYALAAGLGLAYGPKFQAVRGLEADDDGATVELALPDGLDAEGYQLHPSLFDGCLQALFDVVRARFGDDHVGATAYLPQQIGRLRFHGGSGPAARCRVRLDRLGARSILASLTIADATGAVLAEVDGARFVKADLLGGARASALYHDAELVPLVPRLEQGRPGLVRPADLMSGRADPEAPMLDDVAGAFAWAALAELGAGTTGRLEDLATDAAVPVERLELLTHCLDLAVQSGLVTVDAEGTWTRTDRAAPAPEALWRARLAERPDCLPELTVLGRTGVHLPALLRGGDMGVVAPSPAMAEHLGTAGPAFGPGNAALSDAVLELIGRRPAHRRLRILEIHGGHTVLARRILPRLPADAVDYVFTSSDEDVLARAEAEFADTPCVSVVRFDPGAGRDGQDALRPADFDVAIGAGGLESYGLGALDAIAGLLVEDGLLLAGERRPAGWLALCEESVRNWWTDATVAGAGDWQRELSARGWRDVAGREVAQASLVAARAPARTAAAQPGLTGNWVVVVDDSVAEASLGEALAEAVATQGGRVIMVQPGERYFRDGELVTLDVADQDDWGRLWRDLAEDEVLPTGVVHLLGIGTAAEGAGALMALQRQRAWTAMQLVRSLGDAAFEVPPTVTFATAGALSPAVGGGPQDGLLLGLARVLRNEYPGLGPRIVDLAVEAPFAAAQALMAELARPDDEMELVLGSDRRIGLRVRAQTLANDGANGGADTRAEESDLRLDFTTGALERMRWRGQARRAPGRGEVEIRVAASGLNFRDVMFAMGVLPDEMVEYGFAGPTIGMECAGTVVRVGADVSEFQVGDAVMCFAPGCFAGHVTTPTTAVAHKPAALDFDAAATVPIVFFTVYYALQHLARLEPGERVLIHGAAGGVGQAAIQYARHVGAEIYATAGTPEKRDIVGLLGVPEAQILDSRSLGFADRILELTDGEGVDVVLNSLAGEAVHKNLTCLRPFGRFLELGKRDFFDNSRIGLKPFRNNISYFGIDADQLLLEKPRLARRLFAEMGELFERGVFTPLPYRRFAHDEVVNAFRHMQQSRHVGKLVIAAPPAPEPAEPARSPQEAPAAFAPDPAGRYLVTGGLRGFGLATAKWLADKGARDLVLVSRSGPASEEAQAGVADLEARGVRVDARACDVVDDAQVQALVHEIDTADAPLKGVVHAAAVFDDSVAAQMTQEQFERVIAPKAGGAWALHRATEGRALELFVVYSSVTTAFGNPGQANYVAANTALETLVQHRRARGLPGLAVAWSAISDAGYLTRNAELSQQLEDKLGAESLTTAEALAELGRLLAHGVTRMTVARLDWRKLKGVLPALRTAAFAELTAGMSADPSGETMDLQALIADMSPQEVKDLLVEILSEEVGHVLRLPADKVDPNKSVFDLGMDSLMAVELRMSLEQRLGVELPAMALGEGASITRLAERIRDGLIGTETGESGRDDNVVHALAERHSEDIDPDELKEIIEEAETADTSQRLIQRRGS